MPTTEYRILLDGKTAIRCYSKNDFEKILRYYVTSFGLKRVTTEIIDLTKN